MSAQMRPQTSLLSSRVNDTEETSQELEVLLDYLKHSKKCDLTGYKRSTLMRRFQHRMQSINIDSYQSYLRYLQVHPQEYLALLDDVLINVTSFFRDRDAWEYLAAEIVPKIIASLQPNEPIRVWSAGCATGEEIYSFLILLAETLGIEECLQRVQCFATDADRAALGKARQAIYSELELSSIPANLREKYFKQTETGYVFHPELRQKVVFGDRDLIDDSPISKIDLLICRNVIMYFNLKTQEDVLASFHFALKDNGFLFLGNTETIINPPQRFHLLSIKHHIYAKGANLELYDYLPLDQRYQNKLALEAEIQQYDLWQAAYESSPFAQLAVDTDSNLIAVNEQANTLFGLTLKDLYRPFAELKVAKLLDNGAEVSAFYRDRPTTLKNIQCKAARGTKYFDIFITPVLSQTKSLQAVNLTFIETNQSSY